MSERGWLEAKERLEARRAEATPQAGILREDVWAALDEIKRLEAALREAELSGDCISMLRDALHRRFGDEVDAAFFDDVVSNALILSRREAERDAQQQRERLAAFTPTPENVNALPTPLRKYIMELETVCDPAGDLRALVLTRDENAQLRMAVQAQRERADRAEAALRTHSAEQIRVEGEWAARLSQMGGVIKAILNDAFESDTPDARMKLVRDEVLDAARAALAAQPAGK